MRGEYKPGNTEIRASHRITSTHSFYKLREPVPGNITSKRLFYNARKCPRGFYKL